jgi:hypothetical protein
MYRNMRDAVLIFSLICDVLIWYNYWQTGGKLEASPTM